jgi:DNA-binding IscR family transcriptional regulator
MLKFSKKVDYGLIALKYMASLEDGNVASAREIAEFYFLPPDLNRSPVAVAVIGWPEIHRM